MYCRKHHSRQKAHEIEASSHCESGCVCSAANILSEAHAAWKKCGVLAFLVAVKALEITTRISNFASYCWTARRSKPGPLQGTATKKDWVNFLKCLRGEPLLKLSSNVSRGVVGCGAGTTSPRH
jgi:hypothetical protein